MSPATVAMLAALECAYPTFKLTKMQAEFWDGQIRKRGYTSSQLASAADQIISYHTHGNPTLGVVVRAIEGAPKKVAIPVTDAWGRKVLEFPGGPHRVTWEERIVDLAGNVIERPGEGRKAIEARTGGQPKEIDWQREKRRL